MKFAYRRSSPELGKGRIAVVRKGMRHRPLAAITMLGVLLVMTFGSVVLILTNGAQASGITRIQSTTGSNGGATTIAATLGAAPTNGNALIAVVGTRGLVNTNVSSITQTGATWVRAIGRANAASGTTANVTVEIWYALNVSSASTSITVNLSPSVKASVTIAEYSNIASASALDQTSTNAGTSAAATTGTTPTTTVANELWIGGLDQVNTGTFNTPTNGFALLSPQAQSSGGATSTRENSAMLEKVVSATGTASTGAALTSAAWSGAIATFKPSSEFGMAGYRLFTNQDSADVGTALAAQDSGSTLTATGQAFRLRLMLKVTLANLVLNGQTFKLQFRTVGSACDDTGSWTDVTTSTAIAYNNNATPADGAALTANGNDPAVSGSTTRNQTYEELNNFTNSQAAIAVGESGKWDFSLIDNGATADTTYCIRAATSGGATLTNNSVFPAVTTKGPDAILKQDQFDAVRSLLAVGASTGDGASTPMYFDQYMRSASSTDVLVPSLEIKTVGTAFTNAANYTGSAVAYDPDMPDDTRHSCSVYDEANQQMVTWGGFAGTTTKVNINDTWTMTMKKNQRSQWNLLTTSGTKPQANRAHMCVYDSLNDRMIVFGGWNGTTYLTAVWALSLPTNGSTPTWSQLTTSGTLPNTDGRVLSGMAVYDPSPSRMILYGGFVGSTDNPPNVYSLTLPSSGTPAWSNLGLTTGASLSTAGRDSATMVYDAQADRAILFAGIKGTGSYVNEVWSLNLAAGSEAWTSISPTGTAPAARDGHFAAWQTDYNVGGDDRMIVFAGENGTSMSDVWELSFPSGGGTPAWTNRTPGGGTASKLPFVRSFGAFPGVYDPLNQRAVFPYGYDGSSKFEGNAIALDLTITSGSMPIYQLNDVHGMRGKEGTVMVYDSTTQEMVMHGGTGRGSGPTYSYDTSETWKMDVNSTPAWVDANSDVAPTKREFGVSVYDALNSRVVYCTGFNNVAIYPNDCWQMSNPSSGKASWTWLDPTGTAPAGRYTAASIYDSANSRMVMFGGDNTSTSSFNDVNYLTFSGGGGAAWSTPTVSGTAPAARWSPGAIYDPVHQRMLVFGGVNHGQTTAYNDVWELTIPSSGTPTWRQLSPTGTAPGVRRGATVVYDPDRGDGTPRMVVFGGVNASTTHYNDAWELTIPASGDGVWTQLSPSGTAPSTRRSQAGAYDPVNDRMIIYGGRSSSSTFLNDTYSLSLGSSPAWTNLTPQYYIPGTVEVTGLTANNYHWQGWYTGSVSGASLKYSYGGNAESATDFTVTAGSPPASPGSLAQTKVTGGATISIGGWTNESQVNFSALVTDPDASDTLQLCVEKQPLGTGFTNTETLCGTGVPYSGSGVTPSVILTGLTENEYHWQARVKDAAGHYSSWVSFGANAESARDFGTDTSVPTGTVYDGTSAGVDQSYNDGTLTNLSANWSINANLSGVATYEYSIGTTAGATDIANWQTVAATNKNATGLTLNTSQPYYFNIRTTDNAGNTSVLSSNGQVVSPTLGFSVSTSTLTFSALNPGNSYTSTANVGLTVTTNAKNGYQVRASATQDLINQASKVIGMFAGGTYTSPAAWGSGTGFGYNSSDTSVGGSNRFNSPTCPGGGSAPCYAPYNKTLPGDVIVDGTAPATLGDNFTIANRVAVTAQQASGKYTTTLIYSANAQY